MQSMTHWTLFTTPVSAAVHPLPPLTSTPQREPIT